MTVTTAPLTFLFRPWQKVHFDPMSMLSNRRLIFRRSFLPSLPTKDVSWQHSPVRLALVKTLTEPQRSTLIHMPELDWFNHSFVQRNRGHFGLVHHNVVLQQCCVWKVSNKKDQGSTLNGHSHCKASPQAAALQQARCTTTVRSMPNGSFVGTHMLRHSQSVKSHDFARSNGRFQ